MITSFFHRMNKEIITTSTGMMKTKMIHSFSIMDVEIGDGETEIDLGIMRIAMLLRILELVCYLSLESESVLSNYSGKEFNTKIIEHVLAKSIL